MKFITCLAIGGTFLCFHHFIPSPYEQIFDLKWLAIVENKRSNVRVFGLLLFIYILRKIYDDEKIVRDTSQLALEKEGEVHDSRN